MLTDPAVLVVGRDDAAPPARLLAKGLRAAVALAPAGRLAPRLDGRLALAPLTALGDGRTRIENALRESAFLDREPLSVGLGGTSPKKSITRWRASFARARKSADRPGASVQTRPEISVNP